MRTVSQVIASPVEERVSVKGKSRGMNLSISQMWFISSMASLKFNFLSSNRRVDSIIGLERIR